MSAFPAHAWRKSTYSERKYCVEVTQASGLAGIRDTKKPVRSVTVSANQWRIFLSAIEHDRF